MGWRGRSHRMTKTISEWSEITGINKKTIWKRYHKGWSSEEILKEG